MRKIILNNKEYKLINEYKNGFDYDELVSKYTDYFDDYDYIVGDWAYNKLRLKGFCKKENELLNNINDYCKIEDYIKNNCAYDCKYFVVEKM